MTNVPPSSCAPSSEMSLAAAFNRNCRCVIVDEPALAHSLHASLPEHGMADSLRESHPTLFSPTAVFLAREDVARLRAIIAVIERVIAIPAYQERALAWADPIAKLDSGTRGAFIGYDFHLDEQGPKLIEINTNAGGALLNAVLARAARACCAETEQMAVGCAEPSQLDEVFVEMFRREWRAQRGTATLATIAIVDDAPMSQYLYPEFRLFQELFERHGMKAVIADAASLELRGQQLYCDELAIDLVYNRLTDFKLDEPCHTSLRAAYETGVAVVTPSPRAFALYADKRNLTLLSDASFIQSLELSPAMQETLATGVPQTLPVTPAQARTFWAERRKWFFKPAMSFGSRAVYRGDKLTTRVFEEIARGGYVAQARVEPTRRAHPDAGAEPLKYDLRCYVYSGEIQLIAARLYQGQTTNFRTPGGGFAPVFFAK